MDQQKTESDNKIEEAILSFKHDGSIPKPDPERMANSTLCLIRHGTTEFNVVCQ